MTLKTKLRVDEPAVDECSTLPEGLKISVPAKGRIRVLAEDGEWAREGARHSAANKEVHYPTVEDEWEKHDDLKPRDTKESLVRKAVQRKKASVPGPVQLFAASANAGRAQEGALGQEAASDGGGRGREGAGLIGRPAQGPLLSSPRCCSAVNLGINCLLFLRVPGASCLPRS